MAHRFIPMRQTELDTFPDNLEKVALYCVWNILAQNIATERERQARFAFPPFPEIDNFLKTRPLVGELPFVNNQTRIGAPAFYRVKDLIERHDSVVNLSSKKLQRKKRTRHLARHCDYTAAQRLGAIDMLIWI